MIDARLLGKLTLRQLPRPELEPQPLGECAAAGHGRARLGIYYPGERQLFDHGARIPDPPDGDQAVALCADRELSAGPEMPCLGISFATTRRRTVR